MKKELSGFLCTGAILFSILFWACSDLAVDKEEALSVELPGDFNWKEYAEINRDVSSSQIVFDVQKKLVNAQEAYGYSDLHATSAVNTLASSAKRINECMEILKDSALAAKIYLQYANCPKKGWDPDEACTGLYANNTNYTIPKSGGNGVTCSIGACWRDGWDEPFLSAPGYGLGFVDELRVIMGDYKGGNLNSIKNANHRNVISMLCNFILPQSVTFKATEDYLKGFYFFDNSAFVSGSSLNSTLIEQHYFLVGRSEGRPYKYCGGTESRERSIDLALVFKNSNGFTKYDYSGHFFCLNKVDYKIYVTQEGR